MQRQNYSQYSAGTIESEEQDAWTYVQHEDYQLHLVQKVESTPEDRPIVPTQARERRAFYRAYVTSSVKLQIMYMHQVVYLSFYWMNIWNCIFKCLPTNYVHVFLGAFTPDEHLFTSKMVPICFGFTFQVILCSVLQLVFLADITGIFMIYAAKGLVFQTPWSECERTWEYLVPQLKFRCYSISEFHNLSRTYSFGPDKHFTTWQNYYKWNETAMWDVDDPLIDGTYFQTAPIVLFLKTWMGTSILEYKKYSHIVVYMILWVMAGLFHKQLFKGYVFKVLFVVQFLNTLVYLSILLYIQWYELENKQPNYYGRRVYREALELALDWDFDMSASSISGPPVAHFLTSREPEKLTTPGLESFLITVSNLLMYLLLNYVNSGLRNHTESSFTCIIHASYLNPFPIFYLWPLFLHDTILGTFFLRIFYLLNFLLEFLVFTVTYQILAEVIGNEWIQDEKRWIPSVALSILGFACNVILGHMTKTFLYHYSTAITSAMEAMIICWLYPLGRFCDDLHFTYGTPLKAWRRWNIKLLPWYYMYKLHRMFLTSNLESYLKIHSAEERKNEIMTDFSATKWAWVVPLLPFIGGAVYAVVKCVFMDKQKWDVLFRPVPKWGPRDHVTRQLRKRFDSREYVGSQAPPFLSRHLIKNAQTAAYQVDICYDRTAESATDTRTSRPRSETTASRRNLITI